MGLNVIQSQKDDILNAIRNATRGDWKVLVVDEQTKKLLDNVLKEDDILNENITNIEILEQKRQAQDMDAVYILAPLPYVVDCVMADLERGRYRRSWLLWTSIVPPVLRQRIDRSQIAQSQVADFRVINIEYYPRESQLVTFRDPWSFPKLYHPACSNLVPQTIADIAQKVVATCVSLGEYPTIRYYAPLNPEPSHEAHVLCSHLANAIQNEIDTYAKWNQNFPPPSNRPRGALYVVDRSFDLFAPFVHEFTFQAMVHDLLPIKEGDKVTYRTVINQGEENEEVRDMEISEKDAIWTKYRHTFMANTISGIEADFQKFVKDNPHFQNSNAATTNINTIKTMLAGLPQFQEMKEAYSLNVNMATACMDIFQKHQLSELGSLEQCLATGLDEDYKKPKNVADQLIRMLDEDAVVPPDRLRLIAMYVLFKNGLLPSDIRLLCNHAGLSAQDEEVLHNLELLGARVFKQLKDTRPPPSSMFSRKPPPAPSEEDSFLSRFVPNLKLLLEKHVAGTLDFNLFPFVRPDPSQQQADANAAIPSSSLRSAKPTWARNKLSSTEPRQRVIVVMAGGATYSEARSCYEITKETSRDVALVTSHMLTPGLWMRQLGDLSQERRRLGIPQDQPPKQAPKHLFEDDRPQPPPMVKAPQLGSAGAAATPNPPPGSVIPPVQHMQNLRVNGNGPSHSRPGSNASGGPGFIKLSGSPAPSESGKKEKKEKKHHFGFGSSKK
ncbi:uncharacterized protein PV09_09067 [Verruconis gallopava]|uniref:Sec1-like protein n=1 Tax=Verruconis gallopava TaxID=253628 RepID=A0A0D2AJT4_9PEZI|nr:uncharacterized protein PV09_09067 [Verruconis gallopava]KIV99203.1 hypothetical protein PV09_09067 [Verruconis gallopava]